MPIRNHLFLPVSADYEQAHGNVMGLKYITGLWQRCKDQLPWRGGESRGKWRTNFSLQDGHELFYFLICSYTMCGAVPYLFSVRFGSSTETACAELD